MKSARSNIHDGKVRLPSRADNDVPEPLTTAQASIREAVEGFVTAAAHTRADASLSDCGRREKLAAAAQVARDKVATRDRAVELLVGKADQDDAGAPKYGASCIWP